jgi:anti-sigma B factor antagonist
VGQTDPGCSVHAGRVKKSPEENILVFRFSAIRSITDCEAHRMFSEGLSRPDPPFRVTVSETVGRAVVSLEGELDLSSAPELRELLVALAEKDGTDIVLDLTDLVFVDSTGLSVLVMALNRSRGAGGSITLRNPSASVMRILEITGLVSVFSVESAAVRAAGGSAAM